MKIGVISDGQAESLALGEIIKKISSRYSIMGRVLYSNIQPKSTPDQIAKSASSNIDILSSKGVDKVVVILDHEDRNDCPIDFANRIKKSLSQTASVEIDVVIKIRTFENWLISDPDGISQMKSRFGNERQLRKKVEPNKADSITKAEEELNSIIKKKNYHKRQDSKQILKSCDPYRMAKNSRSFRKFLRSLGDPAYSTQSKAP